jgi:hypothetical protein
MAIKFHATLATAAVPKTASNEYIFTVKAEALNAVMPTCRRYPVETGISSKQTVTAGVDAKEVENVTVYTPVLG